MAARFRWLLAGACALWFSGCGTFGDDFDDVRPEHRAEATDADGIDGGLDADRDAGRE